MVTMTTSNYYGDFQKNNATSMLQEFIEKRYDMSVGIWSMSPSRLKVVDFTSYVGVDDITFVLQKISRFNTNTWSLIFRSFSWSLWIALLAMCIFGSVCIALVLKPSDGNPNVKNHQWLTTSMAVWSLQGSEGPYRACSSKIVVVTIYLFCWIIFAIYNGVLISYLTLDTSPMLTTMDDLYSSNFEVGTRCNGRLIEIMKEASKKTSLAKLSNRTQGLTDYATVIDSLCSQRNFAMLVSKNTIKFYQKIRPMCPVYFLKERLMVSYYHFVTKRGTVLNKRISKALTRLREVGAIVRMEHHSQLKTGKSISSSERDTDRKSIDLQHVFIPFSVLIVGIALSLSILTIENVCFNVKRRSAQSHTASLVQSLKPT